MSGSKSTLSVPEEVLALPNGEEGAAGVFFEGLTVHADRGFLKEFLEGNGDIVEVVPASDQLQLLGLAHVNIIVHSLNHKLY